MPRRREWQILPLKDGLFDVEYDRRTVLAEVPQAEAWRHIQRQVQQGEKVFEVDPDGYRFDITRTLSRWR